MPNLSLPVLILVALGVVALIVIVKGFSMPQSFFKKQEKKEALRKILEKNHEDQQSV